MNLNEAISKANEIEGWMEDCQLGTLAELCRDCETFIEVGSFRGKTTKLLSLMCEGTIYAVDHFAGAPDLVWMQEVVEQNINLFKSNLAEELQSEKVILYPYESGEAAEILRKDGIMADCVFIDANHTYEGVKRDIENYLPLVKPGGILCGHDYCNAFDRYGPWDHVGVSQAVDEIFGCEIEVATGIWIKKL